MDAGTFTPPFLFLYIIGFLSPAYFC
jgi:hypothetical protein